MADEPLDLEQAISRVLSHAEPLGSEPAPLRKARGCALAEDIVTELPVQPFDNSAMDGFAVRAADTATPSARLHVVGKSRAGHPAERDLQAGEAIAISTGAMLPGGADAVVRAERTSRPNGEVTIEAAARAGQDIRRAGEDLAPGEIAIERGTVLGPAELGVLASLGRAEVPCHRRPRVAVLTSGDELLEPGEPMRPGGIYDANSQTIPALAERAGATVISVDRVFRVRLFAVLRERAGREEVELRLREGATVAEALAQLSRQAPLSGVLDRLPVRLAVNPEIATAQTPLPASDELALIPPVSGGARPHARVTASPLSPEAIAGMVRDPRAGAIVVFEGVTREVERLEYEAYTEIAEERIAAILAGCLERQDLLGAAAEHRVGAVPLGEPAVVVAVAAAHRAEAFAAAAEALDAIKAEAPIWKREVDGGERRWIEGALKLEGSG